MAGEAEIPRYVDAVVREIARRGAETGHSKADTIFFGGGTPSLLDECQITRILDALFAAFPIEAGAEITCECNPETLTIGFAQACAEGGRQPALDGGASQAGKPLATARQNPRLGARDRCRGNLREAGFENYNIDLMFGLPSQTVADVRETLAAAIALAPTHLSCYGLIVEEGTPICRDVARGKLTLPDEEVERDMYELVRRTLAAHGYRQYEISNFAREGYVCRHNLGCWTRVPYLGFGFAAHSFFADRRTVNPRTIDAYLSGEEPQTEQISREDARFESLMLGLRVTRGVKDDDFARMHGMTIREAFGEKLDKPLGGGLLEWRAGALRLTRLGMDLQNSVLVDSHVRRNANTAQAFLPRGGTCILHLYYAILGVARP